MSKIHVKTTIKADINKVFDLSRDIDLHQSSTSKTNEKAIAGITSGLIEEDETVTWKAKHLGVYQTFEVSHQQNNYQLSIIIYQLYFFNQIPSTINN